MTPSVKESSFGRRLRVHRRVRRLSQGTVARLAGVHPSYVSRLETGRIQPKLPTACRLAAALGLSLDDLVGKPARPGRRSRACPVSTDGRCLLESAADRASSSPGGCHAALDTAQVDLLRRVANLLLVGGPGVARLLEALAQAVGPQG
jgi:transcriptional regulator with XRE-family HTH domain